MRPVNGTTVGEEWKEFPPRQKAITRLSPLTQEPSMFLSFPGGLVVKNPPVSAGDAGDTDSVPRSGRSPGEGNGNPLQYSCLKNPLGGGARGQRSLASYSPQSH